MAMPCFGKNCYSDINSGKIKLFFLEYCPGSSQDRITELFCTHCMSLVGTGRRDSLSSEESGFLPIERMWWSVYYQGCFSWRVIFFSYLLLLIFLLLLFIFLCHCCFQYFFLISTRDLCLLYLQLLTSSPYRRKGEGKGEQGSSVWCGETR